VEQRRYGAGPALEEDGMRDTRKGPRLRGASPSRVAAIALALLVLLVALSGGSRAAEVEDSCIDCHSDPDFLVLNKKLYDYFKNWQISVHAQEKVTCFDCHGGKADVADKNGAHGAGVGESEKKSAVNFKNIPHTCGQCHEEILDAYRESNHFEHLIAKKEEKQGPNCVTCHGSMSTSIPDVTTVEEACARCHNEKTDNHPEIPDDARSILNQFRLIDRFYRSISIRLDAAERGEFLGKLDASIHDLSLRWHTFDLSSVEKDTRNLLDMINQKRDEVRRRTSKARSP
jgi:hypothetical protein